MLTSRRRAGELKQGSAVTITVGHLVTAPPANTTTDHDEHDRDDDARHADDDARPRRRTTTTVDDHARRRPPSRDRDPADSLSRGSRFSRAGARASTRSRSPRPGSVAAALAERGAEVVSIEIARGGAVAARAGRRSSGTGSELAARLPGRAVAAALGDVDVVFPVLHGPFGEDGTVQGLLELAGRALRRRRGDRLGARDGQGPVQVGAARQRHPGHAEHHAARRRGAAEPVRATRCSSSRPGSARRSASRRRTTTASSRRRSSSRSSTTRRCSSRSSSTGSRSRSASSGTATRSPRCPARSPCTENEWYDYEAKYDEGEMELVVPARDLAGAARARAGARRARLRRRPSARAWPASTCSSAATARCS